MTTRASLPPPAPSTIPAHETCDIGSNNHSLHNGHGEDDATAMSYPKSSSLQEACADVHERVSRFLAAEPQTENERRTQDQSRIALKVIGQALQQYDFDSLSLSYNGGKDCLVLLILYLSAIHTHYMNHDIGTTSTAEGDDDNRLEKDEAGQNQTSGSETNTATRGGGRLPTLIPSVYAKPPDPFPQVTSFVETSTRTYHLSLTHISTNPGPNRKYNSHTSPPPTSTGLAVAKSQPPTSHTNVAAATTAAAPGVASASAPDVEETPIITFRDAFALYLNANPQIRAIFVGTRRTDPHGERLTHFDMTDGNWPRFMRIHPVIDWQLGDVWTFLRHPALADLQTGAPLAYCSIYDLGYTSLGGVGDTLRNPKLMYIDGKGNESYRPAYEMIEDRGERLGRE